jgi:hypothetical protein
MNDVSTMSTPYDMSTVQRGARLRRSPFYQATRRYGPKGFTVYNHTLFPINFDDFEAEYWHLLARDALAMIQNEGVKQKIVGIEIDGDRPPRLKRNIGYAWLPVEHTEFGTNVTVETPDGAREATIVPLPFFDPEKQIPKS